MIFFVTTGGLHWPVLLRILVWLCAAELVVFYPRKNYSHGVDDQKLATLVGGFIPTTFYNLQGPLLDLLGITTDPKLTKILLKRFETDLLQSASATGCSLPFSR